MEGRNLNWNDKWHQLFHRPGEDSVLRVSLSSAVPAGTAPLFADDVEVPKDLPDDMVYDRKAREKKWLKHTGSLKNRLTLTFRDSETLDRYHHPRVWHSTVSVAFKVHILKKNPEDKVPFKTITLWKRGLFKDEHCVLRCGRHGETKPFGFEDASRPYLPLAFPGKTGKFEDLFIRVSEYRNRVPYFLKVSVTEEYGNIVVVTAKVVDSGEVPAFLKRT